MIAAILTRFVAPEHRHMIAPATGLRALGLDDWRINFCIPQEIWEATGRDVPEGVSSEWKTVGCIENTLAQMETQP